MRRLREVLKVPLAKARAPSVDAAPAPTAGRRSRRFCHHPHVRVVTKIEDELALANLIVDRCVDDVVVLLMERDRGV